MAQRVAFTADYDSKGDILYLFSGRPYGTVNIELDQNITLRLDPKKEHLVGLIIHQFSKFNFRPHKVQDLKPIAKTLLPLFDQLFRERKFKELIPA